MLKTIIWQTLIALEGLKPIHENNHDRGIADGVDENDDQQCLDAEIQGIRAINQSGFFDGVDACDVGVITQKMRARLDYREIYNHFLGLKDSAFLVNKTSGYDDFSGFSVRKLSYCYEVWCFFQLIDGFIRYGGFAYHPDNEILRDLLVFADHEFWRLKEGATLLLHKQVAGRDIR